MNKEKVLDGLTALLEFTDRLGEANQRASFATSDDTITDEQAIASARQQAEEFVRARNLRGTHPRSSIGLTEEEKKIAGETRAWVRRKDKRFRG